jgi:putative nucleotidyltransferase with HDIG domain
VSAVYRVRQFIRAASAWARPGDAGEAIAGQYLPPEALILFRSMPRYDRQHALNVLHTLQQGGYTNEDLLAAALLHDVGKTVRQFGAQRAKERAVLRLWHRVAVVLVRSLSYGLLDRIAADRSGSWRQPFFVQQHHAVIGAELAQQAGCSARTVDLIRRHEQPAAGVRDPMLSALQTADSAN